MNIIISQYLYPFASCMGGLLILYLCSNSSSVKKLKDMIYELTKEIEYLRKENLKNEKSYADNLQNTENSSSDGCPASWRSSFFACVLAAKCNFPLLFS